MRPVLMPAGPMYTHPQAQTKSVAHGRVTPAPPQEQALSDTNNPYAAPTAALATDPSGVLGGSIEATLAGHGQLEVGATMSEAWANLKGSKRVFFGGFLAVYALLFSFVSLAQFTLGVPGSGSFSVFGEFAAQFMFQLIITAALYPFIAGALIVATRHMCGLPISFGMLFAQYGKFVNLFLTGILQTILVSIGYVLFIIPGIYLSFAYALALPLVADRNMGPWEALETSRKLVTKHWWTVFGMLFVAASLVGLSAMAFLIPLIWTLPWALLCVAVIYRNLAGLQSR